MLRIGLIYADLLETMTMGSGISPLALAPIFKSDNNDWSSYARRDHNLDAFRTR